MSKITDEELIEELRRRIEESRKAFDALNHMNYKLQKLNIKLMESESLKSNFISNIKNELNNPLTSVLILAKEIASGNITDLQTVTSMSKTIFSELFNLDFYLRNIFAAAEIESGSYQINVSKVNFKNLIMDTVDNFQHILDARRINVVIEFIQNSNEDMEFFYTDAEKLQFLIANTLYNSIEYSNDDSKIVLNVWKTKGDLNFFVEDSGTPFSDKDQEEIFGGFRHLNVDLTKKERGKCLSLMIVKSFLEQLGGSVAASNIGEKNYFSVFIPESKKDDIESTSGDGNEFFFDDDNESTDDMEKF